MADESDDDNRKKLEKFEKQVRELSPGFSDMLDDAKPYLAAIANVPTKVALHRMGPEVAMKYLELAHDIRTKEIEADGKKDAELTKRQESAQNHAAGAQKRVMVAAFVELLLLIVAAGVLAYLKQEQLATAALIGALTRYAWTKGKMQAITPPAQKKALKKSDDDD